MQLSTGNIEKISESVKQGSSILLTKLFIHPMLILVGKEKRAYPVKVYVLLNVVTQQFSSTIVFQLSETHMNDHPFKYASLYISQYFTYTTD